MEMTKKIEWAKRELHLLKNDEDPKVKEKMEEYCEAAFHGFATLLENAEKMDNPSIPLTIIIQLLQGKPLSPIYDVENDWELIDDGNGVDVKIGAAGHLIYRSKRLESLYKRVIYTEDGQKTIQFRDFSRSVCVDINTNETYTGDVGSMILDEILPVTMPYFPTGTITIFTEDFKYHKNCEDDYDTIGILYFRTPTGEMKEIKRFFKKDHKTKELIEITLNEYINRKKKGKCSFTVCRR